MALIMVAGVAHAQEFHPLQAGQPLPRVKHQLSSRNINQAGWYPQTVSYVMALQNFDENPEQATLTMAANDQNWELQA